MLGSRRHTHGPGVRHPELAPAILLFALLLSPAAAQGSPGAPVRADSADVPADSTGASREAAPPDSGLEAKRDSGSVDSAALHSRFYEYIAHPFLQALFAPVELVLVPAVKALIYPSKAPLRYIIKEDVIDRTIQLISFGEKDQMMLYPTLNLAPGTGSYTGLTLRHRSLFGRPSEKLVAMGQVYVNGDWKLRAYVNAEDMFGSELESKTSLQLNRQKNTSIAQPNSGLSWAYADSSNILSLSVARRVVERLGAKGTYTFRYNRFDKAPPGGDLLVSDFFRNDAGVIDPTFRGLEQEWLDHGLSLGIFRDTRNNENIPLEGTDFKFNWGYHLTDADHDFHGWEAIWTGFYKLGKERYEITPEEERQAGGMDVKKMLKLIEMRNLRTQIFSRKVVALHVYAAQSYEVPGNSMAFYGLRILGNDTPLRGYNGARFRDYTVAAVSGEYRFPVMRLMDGMIFDEYGIYGRSWDTIDFFEKLRNSWGFGINVRRPDIYLFRVHLGFHGLHGITLNMSVDAYY